MPHQLLHRAALRVSVGAARAKPGVKVERSAAVKDELIISGNDIELVSKSAALINYQARTPPPSHL